MEKVEKANKELSDLFGFLLPFVTTARQITEEEAELELDDFFVIFGIKSLRAMAAYIIWWEENKNSEYEMLGTIAHDLRDRKKDCMSPRTGGYERTYDYPAFQKYVEEKNEASKTQG